ncbi:hypothetical protein BJX66DRAFT_335859 [Aspergillus keveii]|uniref:Uncharacterized protein n=1 Tax=Aspergillus keveii TaxID=714993 RepID=A0ABR4GC53_9EURO
MPVIKALLGISTCLGNTVVGAFLGSWLSVRFWVPRLKRSAATLNTDGLTPKDVNQLRLKKLFLAVERVQSEAIAITESTGLRIGVYDLPVGPDEDSEEEDWDYQIFFKPSDNCLDTVESMTEYIIEHSHQLWHDNEAHNQPTALNGYNNIGAYFASLNRKRGKRPSNLAHSSGWKRSEIRDDQLGPDTLRDKYWPYAQQPRSFGPCWTRIGDGHSHILFTMYHDIVPEEDLLCRRELLAILGFMLTRMKSPYFEDHHVVPVMVISCFKNHSARILQAYLTDCDLIIGQSSLYDFSNPKSRAENLPLFLTYMASEPVGTTRCEAASSSSQ